MEQIISVAYLATNAGAILFVLLVAQYTKPLLPQRFSVRLYVLILSLIILLAATAFVEPTMEGFFLAVINSFIVAAAAMGAYENTFGREESDRPDWPPDL